MRQFKFMKADWVSCSWARIEANSSSTNTALEVDAAATRPAPALLASSFVIRELAARTASYNPADRSIASSFIWDNLVNSALLASHDVSDEATDAFESLKSSPIRFCSCEDTSHFYSAAINDEEISTLWVYRSINSIMEETGAFPPAFNFAFNYSILILGASLP